ncbi:hypothetical protein GCM10009743_12330 [Kribbella swartbergensis]
MGFGHPGCPHPLRGLGSDASSDFIHTKDAFHAHRVTVGAEGWQGSNGYLTFRTRKQTFVTILVAPDPNTSPGPVVMLARAIEPAYGR